MVFALEQPMREGRHGELEFSVLSPLQKCVHGAGET